MNVILVLYCGYYLCYIVIILFWILNGGNYKLSKIRLNLLYV